MLLSDKVIVKSSKYYNNLGYDISDKYIEVDISCVPLGSHIKVNAKCDYCTNEKSIRYKDYNKNISNNNKFSCSIKCGALKAKETSLIKYGVDSTNKLDSVKNKSKQTCLEKYGVSHISKLDSIKERKSSLMKIQGEEISNRIKGYRASLTEEQVIEINNKRDLTNLKKYNTKNVSQLPDVKEKVKNTVNEKYGGFTFQSDILMTKVMDTNMERYGFTNSSNSPIIKSKIIKTNMERYGFPYSSQNQDIKDKVSNSFKTKYGVDNVMLSEEFRSKFDISKEEDYIKYLGNRMYLFNCNKCETEYVIDYDNFYKRTLRNTSKCTNCFPISSVSSIKEKELLEFITSIYSDEILSNYRDGIEIDIYLPELNMGFEFNGLYWHSEDRIGKDYHLNKTNYFKEKGIRIIHIWEDDWDNRRDIIKSQIRNLLRCNSEKIFARNCIVKEVDSVLAKDFLINNHIQGNVRSIIRLGLYHNDNLISLMTFDTSEGRNKMKDNEWNLSRFCSKTNTNIIGAASKLLKYFINNYKPKRIISFADLDHSLGNLYYTLGFNLTNTLKPNYKYIKNGKRINKQQFTKKKLERLGYDKSKTESLITKEMGLLKIFNCGQLKFELLIT